LSVTELFEFDSYRLNPAERLLVRDGVQVPLEPKVFETLLVLIRHGGRVVTKDQLMKEVWPDTFVEESNLVRHISILRKALSRGDEEPPYIETVSKLGYRFVGQVRAPAIEQTELILESAKVSLIVEEESSSRSRGWLDTNNHKQEEISSLKRRWLTGGLTLAVFVAGVTAAALYFRLFATRTEVIDSVAILPFVNVEASPDTEYLADGLTESLTNNLSQLPGLKVMSRDSVVRYKGSETNAQQAGSTLGVRAVLTGRLIQRGNDLIVSAELIDVRDNSHLWGERYDRKLPDLQAVQMELARDVSEQLRLQLSNEAQQRLAKPATENPEAYELYLKGRYALNNLTRQQQSGLGYFEQAVERDPNYALAYAGMAESYVLMADLGATFKLPPKDAYTKAKTAALRAVEIDETLAEAHVSLGRIAFNYEWDWAGAEREFKRAIALKPDFVPAHHWYSHFLISQGRFDESLAESLHALALDPLDVAMNFHLGFHYWNARQYDQATAQLEKTLTMDPNHHETHSILGLAYAQQRRYPEAIAEWQKSMELGGWDKRGFLGNVYAVSGRRGEAQKLLAQLLDEAKSKPVSAYSIARIYTGLGEKEQAFSWLHRAITERDSNLTMPGLKADAQLDSLRSDPRFQELLRRMRLSE
jgi:TolB-like protein/DNA-binding winged helix-turn-helix (wHTH) protein/Tfp pilus assembly protein PilF